MSDDFRVYVFVIFGVLFVGLINRSARSQWNLFLRSSAWGWLANPENGAAAMNTLFN